MSSRYRVIDKQIGETPLEAVLAWKKSQGLSADYPAAYAGRLDPMAEGKLLILLGDECKRQSQYTKLDKEYIVEVVLGASTDTGDALGMPILGTHTETSTPQIQAALSKELGTHLRAYPAFSSKTVKGKPLFMYALQGTLHTISIPEHPETIYSIALESVDRVSSEELSERVEAQISRAPTSDEPSKALGADFRIGSIRPAWSSLFTEAGERTFTIIRIRVVCGSGAYMRTLAERIASSLGTHGFALSIRRTRIGSYLRLPLGFGHWTRVYA